MRRWWILVLSVVVVGAISALPPAIMLILKVAKLDLRSEGVVVVPNMTGGTFAVASSLVLAAVMLVGADVLRSVTDNGGYKISFKPIYMLAGVLAGVLIFVLSVAVSGGRLATAHSLLAGLLQNRNQALQVVLYVLALVVIAPIAEEWLFRGSLLPLLGDAFGKHLALLLSAIAFTLAHGYSSMSWFYMCAGMYFALLVQRKKSLLPAIAAHATFNLLLILYALK